MPELSGSLIQIMVRKITLPEPPDFKSNVSGSNHMELAVKYKTEFRVNKQAKDSLEINGSFFHYLNL